MQSRISDANSHHLFGESVASTKIQGHRLMLGVGIGDVYIITAMNGGAKRTKSRRALALLM